MNCTIPQSQNKQFVGLFKNYKHISEYISIYVYTNKIYLQNMDNNQICLCDLTILSDWFEEYNGENDFCFHIKSEHFSKILATHEEGQQINLNLPSSSDKLCITFKNNKNKKTFKLALQDLQTEQITIESIDYDVEFSLESKIFDAYCNQLAGFGEIINVYCNSEHICLSTKSIDTNMDIEIPIDILCHYELVEDSTFTNYSNDFDNKYFNIIGTFKNVSNKVYLYLQDDKPLEIKISPTNSFIFRMFVAPQIKDSQ